MEKENQFRRVRGNWRTGLSISRNPTSTTPEGKVKVSLAVKGVKVEQFRVSTSLRATCLRASRLRFVASPDQMIQETVGPLARKLSRGGALDRHKLSRGWQTLYAKLLCVNFDKRLDTLRGHATMSR